MEFFDIGSLPPEIQAVIEDRRAKYQMTYEDAEHSIKQFLGELNEDQLVVLDKMLGVASKSEVAGAFFQGRIESILELKFGVCPCGGDHDPDKEFATSVDGDKTVKEIISEFDVEKMAKYNLVDDHGQIVCLNCGMEYASLEDRMRRAPGIEGCSGCLEKEKWG